MEGARRLLCGGAEQFINHICLQVRKSDKKVLDARELQKKLH